MEHAKLQKSKRMQADTADVLLPCSCTRGAASAVCGMLTAPQPALLEGDFFGGMGRMA